MNGAPAIYIIFLFESMSLWPQALALSTVPGEPDPFPTDRCGGGVRSSARVGPSIQHERPLLQACCSLLSQDRAGWCRHNFCVNQTSLSEISRGPAAQALPKSKSDCAPSWP